MPSSHTHVPSAANNFHHRYSSPITFSAYSEFSASPELLMKTFWWKLFVKKLFIFNNFDVKPHPWGPFPEVNSLFLSFLKKIEKEWKQRRERWATFTLEKDNFYHQLDILVTTDGIQQKAERIRIIMLLDFKLKSSLEAFLFISPTSCCFKCSQGALTTSGLHQNFLKAIGLMF